jgi:hypothetical protein
VGRRIDLDMQGPPQSDPQGCAFGCRCFPILHEIISYLTNAGLKLG